MKRKPYNMKYTDLCVYIDNTVYERDENNNPIGLREMSQEEIQKVYNYLYNLLYALSIKSKLFTNIQDYNDFCIETAGSLFMRLRKKNQEYSPDAKNNRAIKSILNYIKGCLPFIAVTWRNNNYAEVQNPEYDSQENIDGAKEYNYELAATQYNESRKEAYEELFNDFPDYVKKTLDRSIFKRNNLKKYQLALSEYLTILNCITVENKFSQSSEGKKLTVVKNNFEHRRDNVINFSTDPMITSDLIDLQIRKTLFLIEDEKSYIDKVSTPSDEELDNILSTSFSTYGADQKGN